MRLIPEINIDLRTLIYDPGTSFTFVDVELARQRLDALNKRNGPRVGDFVWFPNEDKPRRFTNDLSDGSIQTTLSGSHDSSFHIFGDGYCNFSGSLDSAIWLDQCHDTGQKLLGRVWFFSRNLSGPHRGVSVKLPFRVYEYWPIKLICENCQHRECEAIRFCHDCNMKVCQGCFREHVFDLPCHAATHTQNAEPPN